MSEDHVLYQTRVVNYTGGNFILVNFSYYIFSLNNSLGDMGHFQVSDLQTITGVCSHFDTLCTSFYMTMPGKAVQINVPSLITLTLQSKLDGCSLSVIIRCTIFLGLLCVTSPGKSLS